MNFGSVSYDHVYKGDVYYTTVANIGYNFREGNINKLIGICTYFFYFVLFLSEISFNN